MPRLAALGLILPILGGCAAREAVPAPPAPPAAPAAAPSPAAPASVPAAPAPAAPRRPGPPPLTGHVTRAALEDYETWRDLRAQDYSPDPAAVREIAARAPGVETLVIVATWCPDSKREVPRYFKILDEARLGLDGVTLVAVDRTKQDAEGLTARYGIARVPAFVFFRGGAEIGRVVERPATTLEGDIAAILKR